MHRPGKSRRRRSRRGRRSSHVKPSKDFFFNEESVMVYHDEAGHTDGDSIVLFRKSAVLVAGGHIDSPERLSRREIETLRLMGGGHINRGDCRRVRDDRGDG